MTGQVEAILQGLCQGLIPPTQGRPTASHSFSQHLIKQIEKKKSPFEEFYEVWAIKVAIEALRKRNTHRPREPFQKGSRSIREETRDAFQRLDFDSKVVLILRNRYNLPWDQISSILAHSVDHVQYLCLHGLELIVRKVESRLDLVQCPSDQIEAFLKDADFFSFLPETPTNSDQKSISLTQKLGQWSKTPWYIRSGVEVAAASLTIILLITVSPRIQNLFEQKLERKLQDYAQLQIPADHADVPEGAPVVAEAPEENRQIASPTPDPQNEKLKVADSEIWRFVLRTDSPSEMKEKISQLLVELNYPKELREQSPAEAPGGIQFNFIVEKNLVIPTKTRLEQLLSASDTAKQPFTWYKTKDRGVPAGKARVVIWISQI